jgi:hypothetical protein
VGQADVADLHARGLGAERDDLADVLVAHGQRQLDAAVHQVELLASANLVVAIPDMQVGMAHSRRQHLQQHLRALRCGRVALVLLQRRSALTDLAAAHPHPMSAKARCEQR